MRRPSLVGPSVAVGIATMSASDVSDLYGHDLYVWTWSCTSQVSYINFKFPPSLIYALSFIICCFSYAECANKDTPLAHME